MSHARRTLRIPDAVKKRLREEKLDEPLWYVGPLQSENGHDIEVDALPEGETVEGARDEPLVVRPTGAHPGRSLKKTA